MMIYGIGGVVTKTLGFLLLPVFTAYLTPKDYGISSILGWLAFLISPIFSLGLGAVITSVYFGNDRVHKETTIWTAFTILGSSGILLASCGIPFSSNLSYLIFQTTEYYYLIALTLLGIGFTIAVTPFLLYLQFEERAKMYVTLTSVTAITSVALSVFMVVILEKGVQGLVEASTVGYALTFFAFGVVVIPQLNRYKFSRKLATSLVRLGLPLVPSFALVFVLQDGNKYILKWFDGLESLGIYTVGFTIGFVMNLFVAAFQAAWVPYFMSFVNKRDEATELFGRLLTYYVLGFGAITLMFFVLAKPLVILMTQVPYHDAYKVVGLSATTQFLFGIFYIFLPGMYFAQEVRYVSAIQLLAAFMSIALNLTLIPLLGFQGAAVAMTLGVLSMIILTHAWNMRKKMTYFNARYQWHRILPFAVVFLGYVAIASWQRDLSLLSEIGLSVLLAATLPLTLYLFLSTQERHALWSFKSVLVGRLYAKS